MTQSQIGPGTLSPEQIQNRWQQFVKSRSPELRRKLILQYFPLVKYVMGRLALSLPAVMEYGDILSAGTLGLIEAVDRYNPERGVKFQTYAFHRIRGAILDALWGDNFFPRSVHERVNRIRREEERFIGEHGREPSDAELKEASGLADHSWRDFRTISVESSISLDQPVDGVQDAPVLSDQIADPNGVDPVAWVERVDELQMLERAIRWLPPREQMIIQLHYLQGFTLSEIVAQFELSELRIWQLKQGALRRLREELSRGQ